MPRTAVKQPDTLTQLRFALMKRERTLHDFAAEHGQTYLFLWKALKGQSKSPTALALVEKAAAFVAKHAPELAA